MKKYNIIKYAGLLLSVILLIVSFRIVVARNGEKAVQECVLAIVILVVALGLLAWGYIKITAKIMSSLGYKLGYKMKSDRLVKSGYIILTVLNVVCFLAVLLTKAYLICYMIQCALLGTHIGACLAFVKRKQS